MSFHYFTHALKFQRISIDNRLPSPYGRAKRRRPPNHRVCPQATIVAQGDHEEGARRHHRAHQGSNYRARTKNESRPHQVPRESQFSLRLRFRRQLQQRAGVQVYGQTAGADDL